jgi:hypothetical protein
MFLGESRPDLVTILGRQPMGLGGSNFISPALPSGTGRTSYGFTPFVVALRSVLAILWSG